VKVAAAAAAAAGADAREPPPLPSHVSVAPTGRSTNGWAPQPASRWQPLTKEDLARRSRAAAMAVSRLVVVFIVLFIIVVFIFVCSSASARLLAVQCNRPG